MNIVFVGMPGCGKTTIGKIVSEKLSKKFYDIDHEIELREGIKIKDIFKHGENHFRDIEYSVLNEILKADDSIIATGGGVVEREENIESLKTSYVIFLNRDIDDIILNIKDDTRPLLMGDIKARLNEIYNRRINKYNTVSNCVIDVKDINTTVLNIINKLKEEGIEWKFCLYLDLI